MESYKPYAAVVCVQCIYAGMALSSKAAIAKGMDPHVFVVYRQAFASLALVPFAFFLASKQASPISYSILCKIFFVSLLGITLSLNLYYIAINYTSATFAAASTNTIPGITFVLALVLRMETLSVRQVHGVAKLLGCIVSLAGASVFAFAKGPPLSFTKWYPPIQKQSQDCYNINLESIRGSLIMLSANTCWSLWLVLQGLLIKQYSSKVRLIALVCFFSCIQSAVWAVSVQRDPKAWKLQWDVHLFSVAYCGIVVTGMTYWLQAYATQHKGPVFTSAFTPLGLVITAVFTTFLWKETLYWGSAGGTILLVIGLYSVMWGKRKEESVKGKAIDEKQESKEETKLECINVQSA